MRRTLVAVVLTGAAVLAATPAAAAPPEITQRSCELQGATFARVQGIKTCTLRTTHLHGDLPVRVPAAGVEVQSADEVWHYVGVVQDMTLSAITTTWTQKGNGPVTVIGPDAVVIDEFVRAYDCLIEVWKQGVLEDTVSVALSECESRGLLPV